MRTKGRGSCDVAMAYLKCACWLMADVLTSGRWSCWELILKALVSLQIPNLSNQIASLSAREVFTCVYVVESSILIYRFMDRKSSPCMLHSNKNHKISFRCHA